MGLPASPLSHAWIAVDKPKGMTSAQVVARVKRLTKAKKVGHAGTLDPLATGVLPVALGEATKTVAYAMDERKAYRFEITFGEERDTGDAEGVVTVSSMVRPTRVQLEQAIPHFIGVIEQSPPAYSAIKVEGKRAYALARSGQEVALPKRPITIYKLMLLAFDGEKAAMEVECGKGTYIRSLAVDISRFVGALGYVSELRRIRVGKFSENDTISLDKLEGIVHNAAAIVGFKPVDWVLDDILGLAITEAQACRIRQGQAVFIDDSVALEDAQIAAVKTGATLVALGSLEKGVFTPTRVFNL